MSQLKVENQAKAVYHIMELKEEEASSSLAIRDSITTLIPTQTQTCTQITCRLLPILIRVTTIFSHPLINHISKGANLPIS